MKKINKIKGNIKLNTQNIRFKFQTMIDEINFVPNLFEFSKYNIRDLDNAIFTTRTVRTCTRLLPLHFTKKNLFEWYTTIKAKAKINIELLSSVKV